MWLIMPVMDETDYTALQEHYSLIILDIMLPGLDGWQVLRALRTAHQSPVICLTARDSVEDRVKGLEAGANDYLVKPFSFAELLARVRAQLRQHVPVFTRLTINGLDMDATKQSVSRNGKPISLTRKEFLLLWLLASRAGEIVPRTAIASEVWGINFDSETNTVDVAIRRLRAKVDDPFEKKLIMTVRGWVIDYRRKRRRMVKLSMTLRLTISFIAILILACTGISWTLYNALSKELTYRDDMTLINRAAQMQQLLLDGAEAGKSAALFQSDGGYEAGYLIDPFSNRPQCCD